MWIGVECLGHKPVHSFGEATLGVAERKSAITLFVGMALEGLEPAQRTTWMVSAKDLTTCGGDVIRKIDNFAGIEPTGTEGVPNGCGELTGDENAHLSAPHERRVETASSSREHQPEGEEVDQSAHAAPGRSGCSQARHEQRGVC